MPPAAALKSFADLCRTRFGTSHKVLRTPFEILEGADAETKSRLRIAAVGDPGIMGRINHIWAGFRDSVYTPSMLERVYPATFGKHNPDFQFFFSRVKRDQSRYNHEMTERVRRSGIRETAETDAAMYLLEREVLKRHFIGEAGDGKGSLPASGIRALLRRFADNDPSLPYAEVVARHRMRVPTPEGIKSLQNAARWITDTLTDRQIDFVREGVALKHLIRELGRGNMRKYWASLGIPESEFGELELRTFGPDLDAYGPTLRYLFRLGPRDLAGRSGVPELESVFTRDMAALDEMFGSVGIDDAFAQALADLAAAARGLTTFDAPTAFGFAKPDELGLAPRTYRTLKEALADLFDIPIHDVRPGVALTPQQRLDRDALDATAGRIKALAKEPAGSAIGYISMIPERIAPRFYKRRMLSQLPHNASWLRAHNAYMNAAIKFAHLNPFLAGVTRSVREAAKVNPVEAQLFIRHVDRTMGNAVRYSVQSAELGGRMAALFYGATLHLNASAVKSNILGQPGFIIAHAGFVPTITAIRALGHRRGKTLELYQWLEAEGIGAESRPRGSAAVRTAWADLQTATTLNERARTAIRTISDATDIFAWSERILHKVAFLAGMIRHMQDTGQWRPGMGVDALMAAWRGAVQRDPEILARAGQTAIAKGAFLFGNIDNPAYVAWLREHPTGLGAAMTMFLNYPIQSTARLAGWAMDIGRLATDPADKVGREAAKAMFRFFTYGVAIGGPFFLVPILRDLRASGDDDLLGNLKDYFVAWERRFSIAGLMSQTIQAMGSESPGFDIAEGISPFTVFDTSAQGLFRASPPLALARDIFKAAPTSGLFGVSQENRQQAIEDVLGGAAARALTGVGSKTQPLPNLMPMRGAVALARLVNSALAATHGGQYDGYGRLVRPTSVSREIIRQFGRPVDELLAAADAGVANREAELRNFNAQRIRSAVFSSNSALVGELLQQDPSLVRSLEPADLLSVARDRTLVPEARAALRSERSLMHRNLLRKIDLLNRGDLDPAQEFAAKQVIGVSVLRLMREAD